MKTAPENYRGAEHYDRAYRETAHYTGPVDESPFLAIWLLALTFCEGRILDLGCGPGQFAELAVEGGHDYAAGMDFSEEAIRAASIRSPGLVFFLGDLRGLDLTLDMLPPWETAVLVEVLEHLEDDVGLLRRIPVGKRVVLSVPSFLTEGHVRAFESWEDVAARYGEVLDFEGRFEHVPSGPERNRWWIAAGVRRGTEGVSS